MSELIRTTPEEVGIRSEDITKLIDDLENTGSELHGLMVSRFGKVCAEGFWSPYSPEIIHGCQSLSKSYVTTAIGLLITEGKLTEDELVYEIIPQYFPENPSENQKKIRVKDMLRMSAGARSLVDGTRESWLSDFFALDFPDEPGSRFFYSGIVTSVLGVIVRAKTGQGLVDYLKERLFDRIGIDAAQLKWIEHPDGQEYGGGGLFATAEDNLRLGLLYANDGVWEGERILSHEWVAHATTKQIDNDDPEKFKGRRTENNSGYGYQMWMSKVPGVYKFVGAHGQYVVVIPQADMVISLTQFVDGPEAEPGEALVPNKERDINEEIVDLFTAFAAKAEGTTVLPENKEAQKLLSRRLSHLSLERPASAKESPFKDEISGKTVKLSENTLSVLPRIYGNDPKYGIRLSHKLPLGITEMTFDFSVAGELSLSFLCAGKPYVYRAGLDGNRRISRVTFAADMPDMVIADGIWTGDKQLYLSLRFLETCYSERMLFDFEKMTLTVNEYALFSPTGWLEETFSLTMK